MGVVVVVVLIMTIYFVIITVYIVILTTFVVTILVMTTAIIAIVIVIIIPPIIVIMLIVDRPPPVSPSSVLLQVWPHLSSLRRRCPKTLGSLWFSSGRGSATQAARPPIAKLYGKRVKSCSMRITNTMTIAKGEEDQHRRQWRRRWRLSVPRWTRRLDVHKRCRYVGRSVGRQGARNCIRMDDRGHCCYEYHHFFPREYHGCTHGLR